MMRFFKGKPKTLFAVSLLILISVLIATIFWPVVLVVFVGGIVFSLFLSMLYSLCQIVTEDER